MNKTTTAGTHDSQSLAELSRYYRLVRHHLLIWNRGRKRAPNLRAGDRIITGLCTLFMRRSRILRSAVVVKPSTLLDFHNLLRKRKYRMSFGPKTECLYSSDQLPDSHVRKPRVESSD